MFPAQNFSPGNNIFVDSFDKKKKKWKIKIKNV